MTTGFMPTVFEKICDLGVKQPQLEAFVYEDGSLTFSQLPKIIENYETCLLEAGVRPNTTVGIQISDNITHLLVGLALLKLKCDQATLASFSSKGHNEAFADRLRVSSVVSVKSVSDLTQPKQSEFEVTNRGHRPGNPEPNVDPIVYLTTSGTTKDARIIPLSEQRLASNSVQWEEFPSQRTLWLPSIEHNLGKKTRILDIYCGITSVFMREDRRNWSDIVNYASEKKITHLYLPILDAARFARTADRRMGPETLVSTGGARIPWSLRQQIFKTITEKLYILYGFTELYMVSVAKPGDHDERESVGKPSRSVTVEIVDERGKSLPPGEIGEIRVRADGMINSYFDDPVETATRFRDGWFYPGDLGSFTEDGYLIVHGRTDDMMIMNGINIYPGEIERVFESHPEISAAAAFPVKSKVHGEIPAVAIELIRGSRLTEKELLTFSKEKLGVRCPRKVIILDSMPRNSMGKILKTEIAAGLTRDAMRSGERHTD